MQNRFKRSLAAALSLVLALIGLTVLPQSANAAKASMFDPGLIISDSVFFDFGTMTVAEIQRFLDSKVPVCNANDGGPTCLRYYKMDTPAKAAERGRCSALTAKTDQSAAQIIFDVARACGINPRALIVILQKEQGLIQATNPTSYMYKAAFGYGCPDSDPAICGKVWVGLFNQMHRAAGQLQWYGDPAGSFTYLKPGKNVSIAYNPKASCLKKTFLMKSQATANLYYYTPYTPNDAAMKNLYGTGDSCSAYGNRNFWRFYTDWFGSPIGGGFLLKSETSETYLIVDDKKYLIDDPDLLASLEPLGPLGTISDAYLNSFTDSGSLGRLVKSSTGTLYLIDGGQKYTVANCDVALTLGQDCATAVVLTSSQLNALPSAGIASTFVTDPDGGRYFIQNGTKRQILDTPSVVAEGITLPTMSRLKISALSELPWGDPIALEGSMFKNSTTGAIGVYAGKKFYEVDPAMAAEIKLDTWFSPTVGKLNAQGLSNVYSNVVLKPFVAGPDGKKWLITNSGKREVINAEELIANPPKVNAALLAEVPTSVNTLTAPALLRTSGDPITYLGRAGLRRPVATGTDLRELGTALSVTPQNIPASAMSQLTLGGAAFAPGTVVKSVPSKKFYLVDGYTHLVELPTAAARAALPLPVPHLVTDEQVKSYGFIYSFDGLKVTCGGATYVPSEQVLFALDSETAAQWPGKAVKLGSSTCSKFTFSDVVIGQFLRIGNTRYLVQGGKKRLIPTAALYRTLVENKLPNVYVSQALLDLIPTGPKATATVTPGTPVTTAKTYKVVSGDTLSGIAAKFGTTVTKLKTLNRLTSDVISVGQVLTLP
jgi:LysM repeat protein